MITYQAKPDRNDYIAHEKVNVQIRIVNDSLEPLELPDPEGAASEQPSFTLVGPDFPEGETFNPRSRYKEPEEAARASKVPRLMIQIPPHSVWEKSLSYDSLDVSTPGEYRLSSRLEWQGIKAESAEHRFRVASVNPDSIHLGLGIRPFGSGEGAGAFIQHGTDSNWLFSFEFLENAPGIMEAKLRKPIRRIPVGANATDIAVPWRNSPFFNELVQWLVWREGRSLKFLANTSEIPVSFDFPAEPDYLVRPPLKTTKGPVEVLALAGAELYLASYPAQLGVEEQAVKLVWKTALPAKPTGIGAALAPASQGSARHIAFVVPDAQGFAIYHSRYLENAPPEPFQSVRVPQRRLLGQTPPALFVDKEGQAHVGILAFAKPAEDVLGSWIEIRFDPNGQPIGQPQETALGPVPTKPLAGAWMFVDDKQGNVSRREAVLELADQRILKMSQQGRLVPAHIQASPARPLQLAPGRDVSYLLYLDPRHGLYLEPL